ARSRVLEYMNSIRGRLPQGVNPVIGPDATSVGWVFQYALVDRSGRHDLAELRTFQDFNLRYALASVPGVAEVASVGGYQRQYQVEVDPAKLHAYGLSLADVTAVIRRSNSDVGGRVIEMTGREYFVRGRGYVKSLDDLREIALAALRSTLVPVLSLPVAVGLAFVPMYFLGINSNIMSLGGIAIAIGAMVDAAIVLVENAHKHLESAPPGANHQKVVIEAAKEVGPPI